MNMNRLPRIRVGSVSIYIGYAENLEKIITVGGILKFKSIESLNDFINTPVLTFASNSKAERNDK